MKAQYRLARNAKTQVSGCHDGLAAHVKGKMWLLYYDHLLKEEDNSELGFYAFPLLLEGVSWTSTDADITPKRHRVRKNLSSASNQSFLSTPSSGYSNITAAGATITAMSAVEERMTGLNSSENFMHSVRAKTELSRLKTEINKFNAEYNHFGSEYLVAKNAGKVRIMKELKGKRNGLKSEIKMAEKNYTELKTNLGYESPECSSASSPSENENGDSD